MNSFNYKEFSNKRCLLMGIATLLVILRHSQINIGYIENIKYIGKYLKTFVFFFQYLSQSGVDVFLILSAIGLSYAIEKYDSIKKFYYKRFVRVFVPTLISLIFIRIIKKQINVLYIVKTFLGISLLKDNDRFLWYIAYIFYIYMLFPLLYRLKEKYGKRIYLVLIVVVILRNIILSLAYPLLFKHGEILFRRSFVFLLGCYIAEFVKENKIINGKSIFISSFIVMVFIFIVTIKGYENNFVLWKTVDRYLESIFALAICIFTICLDKILKYRNISFAIEKIGDYSLEIYLVHEPIISYLDNNYINDNNYLLINIIGLFVVLILVILIKKIGNCVGRLAPYK